MSIAYGGVLALVHPCTPDDLLKKTRRLWIIPRKSNNGIEPTLYALCVVPAVPCIELGYRLQLNRQTHAVAAHGVGCTDKIRYGRVSKFAPFPDDQANGRSRDNAVLPSSSDMACVNPIADSLPLKHQSFDTVSTQPFINSADKPLIHTL
jgi:hypothetical protein